MAEPIKKVSADATVWLGGKNYNRIADVVNRVDARTGTSKFVGTPQTVAIINNTTADIPAFTPVLLGLPFIEPGDQADDEAYTYMYTFNAEETDVDSQQIGLTKELVPVDIGGGEKGTSYIVVQGVTNAVINVTDVSHQFAKLTAVAHELESTNTATSIRILYSQQVGTDELCKVMIGGGTAAAFSFGKADGDITPDTTVGSVDVWDHTVSPPTSTGTTLTGQITYDWGSDEKISDGKEVIFIAVGPFLRILFAECETPPTIQTGTGP
jgi:hypothetical protein